MSLWEVFIINGGNHLDGNAICIHRKHPVILWFSVHYAAARREAAAARREIFGVNALGGKQQQLGSPNLQDIFIGG